MATRRKLTRKDINNVQKTEKQRTEKQAESLMQLIDLPDFDVSQFFQALMRSLRYEEVLNRIPKEKQISFFTRNFVTFIETQDELAQLKLPELQEIPKVKIFKFDKLEEKQQVENADESSVLQIVDSFGAVVLEKNTAEIVRILKIINEMKQHSRYQNYFNLFSINQLFRQSYETFLETCDDREVLITVGETVVAMRKYLKEKTNEFMNKIRTDMNIDNTIRGVKKIMEKLATFIQTTIKQCKQQFPPQKIANPYEADVIIPKFLLQLSKQFYTTIQPCIYEKEELSEILQALQIVLQSSNDLESKGINLSRDFRQLISHDLPMHMNKIIEVVIEAFDDILKEDNSLYQFKYFDSLSSLGLQMQFLNPIKQGQYGKKCCSKKGILLINAFVIILEPLCDDKWMFLQENVIEQLLGKVSGAIYESNWDYWDYFQLFYFFQRFRGGKIKHKKLFKQNEAPPNLKEKMNTAQKISMDCWDYFQTKITNKFWVEILSKIPKGLWQIKDYIQTKGDPYQKPTIFGTELVFSCEEFLKNIQFRIQRPQFQYLIARFYEYILYLIEYILYFEYHSKGTKDKVFSLFQRSEKIYKKAKNFVMEELQIVKEQKKILTIGLFTKSGLKNFALDIYFFTQALKQITQYQKLACEQFLFKTAQIQSKQHKTQPVNLNRQEFTKPLQGSLKVYRDEPEKIKQYMERKRKQLKVKINE